MTRRLRTDRMTARAREARTTALLRDAYADVRAKVASGEWSAERALAETCPQPIKPYDGLLAVLHPGSPPRPYLKPALDAAVKTFIEQHANPSLLYRDTDTNGDPS